jgi:hypothetical protein
MVSRDSDSTVHVAFRSWRSTFWTMSFYVILCHFMSFMYIISIYILKISSPNISRVPDGQSARDPDLVRRLAFRSLQTNFWRIIFMSYVYVVPNNSMSFNVI